MDIGRLRVVEKAQNGKTVYLGLSDHGARHVLHTLGRRLLMVWGGMFLLGFVISYWSARRTLHRVERITETVGANWHRGIRGTFA